MSDFLVEIVFDVIIDHFDVASKLRQLDHVVDTVFCSREKLGLSYLVNCLPVPMEVACSVTRSTKIVPTSLVFGAGIKTILPVNLLEDWLNVLVPKVTATRYVEEVVLIQFGEHVRVDLDFLSTCPSGGVEKVHGIALHSNSGVDACQSNGYRTAQRSCSSK